MARLLFTAREFGSLADPVSPEAIENLETLIGKPVQLMQQTHGNNLFEVKSFESIKQNTDSLITSNKDLALAVRVADCIPLLLYSASLIAAVHVGRRGLINEVAAKTVAKMRTLGAIEISGVAGPHICGDCYEVGDDMAEQIHKSHPTTGGKKGYLNLFAGLKDQIKEVNLENVNICTKENNQYFSYRNSAEPGRQVGVISL